MALDNATTTKALQLGCGVISTVGDVFAQQFAGHKAIIVADKTTWHVAGAKVAEILARDGIAPANLISSTSQRCTPNGNT